MDTKLLALDTSTTTTGWALFVNGKYKKSGCLKATDKPKYRKMEEKISWLINTLKPDIIIIEMPVVMRNAVTQRELCMIYGVVDYLAFTHNIEVNSIVPSQWRKYAAIATGFNLPKEKDRKSFKAWACQAVCKIIQSDFIPEDEAESILIGIGYMEMFKEQIRKEIKYEIKEEK